MIENAILSTSKIYENNRSSANIKNINNFIFTNIKYLELKAVPNNKNFKYYTDNYKQYEKVVTRETHHGYIISVVLDKNLNCIIIDQLMRRYFEIEATFFEDIAALKAIRDTSIAHTDKKTKKVDTTTWDKIYQLLEFGIEYLDIVETVYLATSSSIEHDGKKACRSLARMMKDLNLVQSIDQISAIN